MRDLGLTPAQLEKGGQATLYELLEVNLGTEDEPRSSVIRKIYPPQK